jgi:hypothetical protein
MWPKTENFNDESMGSIKSFSYKIAENVDLQQLLDQGHMQPVSGLGPRNCLRLLEMAEPAARDVDLGVDVWEAMATSIEDLQYTPPKAGPRNNIVQLDMNQKQDVLEKQREVERGREGGREGGRERERERRERARAREREREGEREREMEREREREVRPWCTRHGFVTFTLVSVFFLCDTQVASLASACPAYISAIPSIFGKACSFPHFVMHLTARLSLWIVLRCLGAFSRTRVHAKCRSTGTCGRSTADVCSLLLSPKRVSGRCW